MTSFIAKVRSTFKDMFCDCVVADTIIFRRNPCHFMLKKFDLNVFIEKLDKLIQETPEIQQPVHVEIHYRMVDSVEHFNMFGIEIPHITDASMDFKQKLDDLDSIFEEFFAHVHRDRFVDFDVIEVKFPGVKVMGNVM